MSLITCSECGGKVSTKASACVHCGAPIEASTSTQSAVQKDQTEQQETIQSTEEDRSIAEAPNPIVLTGKISKVALPGSYGKIQADNGQEYEYLYESVKGFGKLNQHRWKEVRINVIPGSNRVQSVEILSDTQPEQLYSSTIPSSNSNKFQASQQKSDTASGWQPKWLFQGAAFLFLVWVFTSGDGREFLNDFLNGINTSSNIEDYDCDRLANQIVGESLQNIFGGRFEIIRVTNIRQISHNDQRLACEGDITLSNNTTDRMDFALERQGGQIFWSITPQ